MLRLTLDRTEGTFEVTSEDRVYIRDEEVKISVAGFKFIELYGDTSLAPCFQVICGQKVLAEAMLAYDKSASDTANDYGYAASGTLNTNTEQLVRHFGGCADQTCQSLVCRVFSTAKMKPIAMGYVSLWNFPNGGTEPSNLTTGADLQKRIDAALTAATNAETSATKAGESATAAAASASDAAASASTAKAAMESAQAAQNVAETKANVATEQASNALTYANAANASEAKAKTYAENAEASADAAAESAKEAASILPASVQDALGKFLSGQTFKTNTTNAMRNAMKTLLKALGATVSVLALTFCGVCVAADTPTVTKASLGDLDLDQNPTVVTDVSFSGLATKDDVASAVKNVKVSTDGLVTSNDLAAALASAVPGDYANVSNRAVSAVQAEVDPIFVAWTNGDSVALGNKATASKDVGATALGSFAEATNVSSVAIGFDAKAKGRSSVAIGDGSVAVGAGAVALGYSAYASNSFGVAVLPDKFVFGASEDNPGKSLQSYLDECGKVKSVNNQTGDVEVTAAGIGAATEDAVAEVSQLVGEVWTYLKGDNFRVVVTNYDSAVNPARTRYEYRMATNEAWKVVWREADGLADAVAEATNLAATATAAEIAKPANRAWGGWDSHTGEAAPDGVAQISGEGGLLLGGGGGWTQVSSGAGSYWVLASTDPTICATAADGKFSITDPDGNAVMTVTKSDRRLVYATAGGITAGASSVVVKYSVASAEHPTCEMATDLNGAWYAEGDASAPFSVAWSGSSGAWVMTATAPSGGSFPKTGFFRATYTAGGDTVTAFGKGVRFDGGVVIDGTTFMVGTATVDGKTVLTLTAK